MNWKYAIAAAGALFGTAFSGLAYQALWDGDVIEEEPVIFIAGTDGAPPSGKLLTAPAEILRATNSDATVEYAEGRDFTVEIGRASCRERV